MYAVTRIALAAGLLFGLPARSQAQTKPSRSLPAPLARTASAVRVGHAPRVDGTLNDPLWLQATPITDFRQREPYEGQPATESTEVRIVYTHNEIYFGIACLNCDAT